ncbi:MAG: parallel beta-helix domain-containing protein [Planctomycetota bacterium]|nr:parallel beta-helix domain-containing protein [Planctomycetota bacterium]
MQTNSARLLLLTTLLFSPLCGCETDPASAPGDASVQLIQPGPDAQKRLQRAFIAAKPGDRIELAAGKFELEGTLSLDVKNVTLRGQGHGQTILDFSRQQAGTGGEGLLVTAGPIVLEDFAIENAKGDAVKVTSVDGVTFRRIRTEWTGGADSTNGSYGIYPVLCKNVLVEECVAIGASDAGVYVGQSENIIVRKNRVTKNVAGIEIENSIDADVYENDATDNSGGILVFSLPNLPKKVGRGCRVFKNKIVANNHPNFAPAGNIVAMVPPGTGLMIMAYDQVEAFDNDFENNGTANVAIVSYLITLKKLDDPEYDPYPESISIHHNRFKRGTAKPDKGPMGILLTTLVGNDIPSIVYDGDLNKATLIEGKLPESLRLAIHDNTDADFVDLNLLDFNPLMLAISPPKIRRDLTPHAIRRDPLPAVTLK